ncbi:MAG TPA: TetR/AcrR family transcriptional regulator [Noviherbaspirillum sp.]|nr:TetR/AcrR family transcriptional regulator [Noviherbaspirillum sp.]
MGGMPEKRDGRKENAAATQAALRAAGRRLFAGQGYDATSVGALCAEAGVTTGALYHHYGDKKGLFAAVAEELECGLVELAMRTHLAVQSAGGGGWDAFLAAVDVILDAGADPQLRRIGLVEAPAVLGAAGWQAIREKHGHGAMTRSIAALQAQGEFGKGDPKRLAWLVLGLVYSAAQTLPAEPALVPAALDDSKKLVRAMLRGLRNAGAER